MFSVIQYFVCMQMFYNIATNFFVTGSIKGQNRMIAMNLTYNDTVSLDYAEFRVTYFQYINFVPHLYYKSFVGNPIIQTIDINFTFKHIFIIQWKFANMSQNDLGDKFIFCVLSTENS